MTEQAADVVSLGQQDAGRHLNRFTSVLLVGYLAFIVLFMVLRRSAVTPDVFFVFVSAIAVMLGRGKTFVRDWGPFVLLFLAWEAMRGIAYQFGGTVQSDSIIALERFTTFGHVLPETLQAIFYVPGRIGPFEIFMAAVYVAHFVLPLTVAFLLWVKRRAAYYHYVIALMAMSFAQFFTAILIPVAPPRYAGQFGEALHVVDIGAQVSAQTGIGVVSWAYQNINANPVAAFPSLHARIPCSPSSSCGSTGPDGRGSCSRMPQSCGSPSCIWAITTSWMRWAERSTLS
jgi:hypothetical protein